MDPADEIAALERDVARLAVEADAAVARYDHRAWVKLALVFFPVPFIVVVFRLSLGPTGYYTLGAALAASAAAMWALDRREVAARDRAVEAADRARRALDLARAGS